MFTTVVLPGPDTMVFRFSTFAIILTFVVSAAIVAGGAVLKVCSRRFTNLAYWLVAMGLIGLLVLAPSLVLDRVTVTNSSITQVTGFWWRPNRKGFEFAGVSQVEIRSIREKKGEPAQTHWFVRRGPSVEEIDPGDLWTVNTHKITPWLERRGIRVVRGYTPQAPVGPEASPKSEAVPRQ